jgi:hypothetical protein
LHLLKKNAIGDHSEGKAQFEHEGDGQVLIIFLVPCGIRSQDNFTTPPAAAASRLWFYFEYGGAEIDQPIFSAVMIYHPEEVW